MVGTVEEKFCTAGNGAIFADIKMVVVDGIVIKDVVAFKVAGIVEKIVVDSVFADLNGRVADGVFQIDGLWVVAAWIEFVWIHGGSFILRNGGIGYCQSGCSGRNKRRFRWLHRQSSLVWPKALPGERRGAGQSHQ